MNISAVVYNDHGDIQLCMHDVIDKVMQDMIKLSWALLV